LLKQFVYIEKEGMGGLGQICKKFEVHPLFADFLSKTIVAGNSGYCVLRLPLRALLGTMFS